MFQISPSTMDELPSAISAASMLTNFTYNQKQIYHTFRKSIQDVVFAFCEGVRPQTILTFLSSRNVNTLAMLLSLKIRCEDCLKPCSWKAKGQHFLSHSWEQMKQYDSEHLLKWVLPVYILRVLQVESSESSHPGYHETDPAPPNEDCTAHQKTHAICAKPRKIIFPFIKNQNIK